MDLVIFNFLHGLAGKSGLADLAGIFFAKYLGYFLFLIFLFLIFWQRDGRKRLNNIFFTLLSVLLSWGIIKQAFNFFLFRPRPFAVLNFTPLVSHDADAAFPSGHAVFYFTIATIVWLVISRRWGSWFFVGATLIVIARVFVGVHWPSDVISGAAIGILSPFLVRWILPKKPEQIQEHNPITLS